MKKIIFLITTFLLTGILVIESQTIRRVGSSYFMDPIPYAKYAQSDSLVLKDPNGKNDFTLWAIVDSSTTNGSIEFKLIGEFESVVEHPMLTLYTKTGEAMSVSEYREYDRYIEVICTKELMNLILNKEIVAISVSHTYSPLIDVKVAWEEHFGDFFFRY